MGRNLLAACEQVGLLQCRAESRNREELNHRWTRILQKEAEPTEGRTIATKRHQKTQKGMGRNFLAACEQVGLCSAERKGATERSLTTDGHGSYRRKQSQRRGRTIATKRHQKA